MHYKRCWHPWGSWSIACDRRSQDEHLPARDRVVWMTPEGGAANARPQPNPFPNE